MRKIIWIAAAATFLQGTIALTQGTPNPAWNPYGKPESYGYPGYGPPTAPPPTGLYGPLMPTPFAVPMQPGQGQPMRVMPPASGPARELPPIPVIKDKPAPSEPYFVTPNSVPPVRNTLPPAEEHPPTFTEILQSMFVGETEPYTVHEGCPSPAERRHDGTHHWFEVSYLHWWFRQGTFPTLLTSAGNPIVGADYAPREFSGVQVFAGFWLQPEHVTALEFGGQWLGKHRSENTFRTDAFGAPPFNSLIPLTGPGFAAGSVTTSNVLDFHSAEVNHVHNLVRYEHWTVDSLIGGRYMCLSDSFRMSTSQTALADNVLAFGGAPLPTGSNLFIQDSFATNNRFYGGQIGARVHWTHCRWNLGMSGKIAFGSTFSTVQIDGTTTLDGAATLPGGTLAQGTNSGRHVSNRFTVVPEISGTVSYQVSPCFRLLGGYTFLYWNRLQRSSDQIDATGAAVYSNGHSDFWAQGIHLGAELKW